MGDTTIGTSGSAGGAYVDYSDCDVMEGLCYGSDPTAAPPPANAGKRPVADDCQGSSPLLICEDGGEDVYEVPEWNNGKGPTRLLDPDYAASQYDACEAEAVETYNRCMATKQHNAQTMCQGTDKYPGRGVDGRPVEPGQEQACVDGWVYGTDAWQAAHGENESTSEATTKGTSKQGGGGVKIGGKLGPVTIEGNGSGSLTKNEATTNGSQKGTSHTDTTSKAARPGGEPECRSAYDLEINACGARPFTIYP